MTPHLHSLIQLLLILSPVLVQAHSAVPSSSTVNSLTLLSQTLLGLKSSYQTRVSVHIETITCNWKKTTAWEIPLLCLKTILLLPYRRTLFSFCWDISSFSVVLLLCSSCNLERGIRAAKVLGNVERDSKNQKNHLMMMILVKQTCLLACVWMLKQLKCQS